MTDAERFAWDRLRYRQMGGHKFRRQVELGPYIADFVCLERRLVVELDGGQHAERAEQDRQRTRWLEGQGFRVLRFWNHEVLRDWEAVERCIWQGLGEAD
jgi:very-short-patch-repair endonuclease